jgi:phage gpG-like protein
MIKVNVNIDDSVFRALMHSFPELKEKANRAAGFVLMDDIAERFEGEGNPPTKWTPLQPITIKRRMKRANGGAIRILNDSGALKGSFMVGGDDNFFKATQHKVTVGTKKVYAAPHQWGWKAKNIPARPMIVAPNDSPDLKDKLINAYAEVLRRGLL